MRCVVGLDLSLTATGWFLLIEGNPIKTGVLRTPLTGIERIDWIAKRVVNLIGVLVPEQTIVVIEGYSFASTGNVVYEIGGLGTMVRHALWSRKIPYIECSPNSLKKFATGSGDSKKVKKEHVIREVWRRWNFEASDNNEADAYVLGRIGMCMLDLDEPTTDYQRAVLIALMQKLPAVTGATV